MYKYVSIFNDKESLQHLTCWKIPNNYYYVKKNLEAFNKTANTFSIEIVSFRSIHP